MAAIGPLLHYAAAVAGLATLDSSGSPSPTFTRYVAAATLRCRTWLDAPENLRADPTFATAANAPTASSVLALKAYLGPDTVRSSMDHQPHEMWITCVRHLDHLIDTIMDFSDPQRFSPTALTPHDILRLYQARAVRLRNYGSRLPPALPPEPALVYGVTSRRSRPRPASGRPLYLTGRGTRGTAARRHPIRLAPPEPSPHAMIT